MHHEKVRSSQGELSAGEQGENKGITGESRRRVSYMLRLIHYGSPAWLIAPVPERARPPCIYSPYVFAPCMYTHSSWTALLHAYAAAYTMRTPLFTVVAVAAVAARRIHWIYQLFRSISSRAQCRRVIREMDIDSVSLSIFTRERPSKR